MPKSAYWDGLSAHSVERVAVALLGLLGLQLRHVTFESSDRLGFVNLVQVTKQDDLKVPGQRS
jgi:hypothetical protein